MDIKPLRECGGEVGRNSNETDVAVTVRSSSKHGMRSGAAIATTKWPFVRTRTQGDPAHWVGYTREKNFEAKQ